MTSFDWSPADRQAADRLSEARVQLLSAAQWLARVERSFGPEDDDLTLRWSDERMAIATRAFASDIRLELQIDDLVMQFTEGGKPSDHEIDIEERSPAHIEAWILIELLHRGVDRDSFSKDLPYDTSAMLNGDGVEFSPGEYKTELRALGALFREAVLAIGAAASDRGSIRISPRDLAVEAETGGRVIGFSLGDEMIAEPFAYVKGAAGAADAEASATAILRASEIGAAGRLADFFASAAAPTKH